MIRQFVWVLEVFEVNHHFEHQVTHQFNELFRYSSRIGHLMTNERFKLKSLIMAQIERWRQA